MTDEISVRRRPAPHLDRISDSNSTLQDTRKFCGVRRKRIHQRWTQAVVRLQTQLFEPAARSLVLEGSKASPMRAPRQVEPPCFNDPTLSNPRLPPRAV